MFLRGHRVPPIASLRLDVPCSVIFLDEGRYRLSILYSHWVGHARRIAVQVATDDSLQLLKLNLVVLDPIGVWCVPLPKGNGASWDRVILLNALSIIHLIQLKAKLSQHHIISAIILLWCFLFNFFPIALVYSLPTQTRTSCGRNFSSFIATNDTLCSKYSGVLHITFSNTFLPASYKTRSRTVSSSIFFWTWTAPTTIDWVS